MPTPLSDKLSVNLLPRRQPHQPRYAQRPPALTVLALLLASVGLGAPVWAQQLATPSQAELDEAIREGAKPERTIPTPGSLIPRPNKKDGPRELEANNIEGINGKTATAEGRVKLTQDTMQVRAERLDYNQITDTATTIGKIKMLRDGDAFEGYDLKFKLDTEVGTLLSPNYFFGKSTLRPTQRYEARGSAERMNFEGVDKERLFNANYTTCKPNQDEWYLRVSELELNRTTNIGTGYNSHVEFKGVPILYLPYISFPLNSDRKSGFLSPTFGTSSNSGVEFSIPYYWNIAPNIDTTITPKILTKRGVQIADELRYLTPTTLGQLDAEFLPDDRKANRNRYLLGWRHYQNLSDFLSPLFGDKFSRGWNATVNTLKVSDDAYFRDLSTRIANTAQTNLPRDFAINYVSDFGNLSTHFLSFQTLQDPLAPVVRPYFLAPQITFNARPARVEGLEFNTVGEFTDFTHPTLVSGRRILLYPSVAYQLKSPYGFVMPKIGFHATRYDLTSNKTGYESQSRTLPIVSVDSGLALERPVNFGGEAITQTLEPRLFLLYVPFKNQSTIPVFSTSVSDFNFSQIFNENLFIGGDRIADAKQATAAVTTRFIEDLTGIERIRLSIGQRYYFSPQRVTLPDTALSGVLGVSGTSSGDVSRSDFLMAASGQIAKNWTLDSGFQYSASRHQFQQSNIAARYNAVDGRLFNLGYRFTRDSIKQIDIAAQWPLGTTAPGWTLLGRANHSLADKRLLEGLLGVEYNQGCWEFRLIVHRFATATQQYSNSIQFQLELKGLSNLGVGVNPIETLRQNISGYKRSVERGAL